MRRRFMIASAALVLALGLAITAVTAAAAVGTPDREEPEIPPAEELRQSGYVLTEYGDGLAVFRDGELIIRAEVDVDSLRAADRELLKNGIETESFSDVLRLLEDFDA